MREDRKCHDLTKKIFALSIESSEMQVNWAKDIIRHVDWVAITEKPHSPRHPPVPFLISHPLLGEHLVFLHLVAWRTFRIRLCMDI